MKKIIGLLKKNKQIVIRVLIIIVIMIGIGFLMYIPSFPYRPPKVVSVSPTNGQTDVINKATITVIFDKPVPSEEREAFYLRLLPGVAGISRWVSATELVFTPTDSLQPSTTYKLALSYGGETLVASQFSTRYRKAYSEAEFREMNDWAYATSRAMFETFRDYPFLEYMPISRDNFNVMFDSSNEQFRYLLKMDPSVPEETKQEAIDDATEALISIGVDVNDYGYYIMFSSELAK